MAKRFTDSEKWKKGFIRELPPEYKLLWFYILDECDHAGIWHVEFDVASMRIGIDLKQSEALAKFHLKVYPFDGGDKWFIPDFISFQYGELNPSNRAHKSVMDKLLKYDLIDKTGKSTLDPIEAPSEAPYKGVMDKDKEMDKDMVKDKGAREKKMSVVRVKGGGGVSEDGTRVNGVQIPGPLMDCENIGAAYQYYCEYIKENYQRWPTLTTTQMDLQTLVELQEQGNDPIAVIKQTIHGKNKSFFKLRGDFKTNQADARESFSEYLENKEVV